MRGFEWYKLHQNLITRSRVICDFVYYTNHVIGIAELRITMRNSIQKSAILRIWRNNCSVILSGLTVGQAAHLSLRYRAGIQQSVRRSYMKDVNLVENNKGVCTAAKITLRINGKVQTAIIDSGAATSIITKPLLSRLGYQVDKASKLVIVTANG